MTHVGTETTDRAVGRRRGMAALLVCGVLAVTAACTGMNPAAVTTSTSPGGEAASGSPDPTAASVPGLDASALAVMNQPAYAQGQWAIAVKDRRPARH
jgi:D-alanyl-D-alanine carboxypeptidase/D-alanyl-D-alanine-endopeptidase (penicillin-binding protein 4)